MNPPESTTNLLVPLMRKIVPGDFLDTPKLKVPAFNSRAWTNQISSDIPHTGAQKQDQSKGSLYHKKTSPVEAQPRSRKTPLLHVLRELSFSPTPRQQNISRRAHPETTSPSPSSSPPYTRACCHPPRYTHHHGTAKQCHLPYTSSLAFVSTYAPLPSNDAPPPPSHDTPPRAVLGHHTRTSRSPSSNDHHVYAVFIQGVIHHSRSIQSSNTDSS